MPAEVIVAGTMRAFDAKMQGLLDRRIEEVARLAAATQGATAEVELYWGAAPLLNHAAETDAAAAAATLVAGAARVDANTMPITAGEDFAFMLQEKPGAMIFLGNGAAEDGPVHGLHTPTYDFNDAALPVGIRYWVSLVEQELGTIG
jgi:hippurate hydrolase